MAIRFYYLFSFYTIYAEILTHLNVVMTIKQLIGKYVSYIKLFTSYHLSSMLCYFSSIVCNFLVSTEKKYFYSSSIIRTKLMLLLMSHNELYSDFSFSFISLKNYVQALFECFFHCFFLIL